MGAALLGGRDRARAIWAAAGGLAPDVPSFLLVLWAGLIQRRAPGEIFDRLYFSPEWQAIMAPSHAAPLWLLATAAGLWLKRPLLTAFAGSGLLHQLFDFALHAEDAHRHLWPLSDWRFFSPVSYWDPAHYGGVAAPLEMLAGAALAAWLARVYGSRWARLTLGLIALAYAAAAAALIFMIR